MNRITATVVAASLLIGATLGAAPAVAQADGTAFDDVIDTGEENGLDVAKAGYVFLSSSWERGKFWVAENSPLGTVEQTADQEIATVANYYNAHNATLEAYVNNRTTLEQNHTIKLSLHIADTTATRYLEADVASGNVTSSRIVTSTDRTVTDRADLCGLAAEQAAEELEAFHDDYAAPGEDVDLEYLAKLRGKYGSDVDTTLVQSGGECPS